MQTSRFEKIQCWRDERVDAVFNKEAASVDRSTFLATHMPLQSLTYRQPMRQIVDKGEEAFLQELQRCARDNQHAFVVVQGIPGTGKSHLIRWLKERYFAEENLPGERILFIERAHSSLRGTLEQIIRSEIFDDATMQKQLEKLEGAHTSLSEDALANNLLTHYMNAFSTEEARVALPSWLRRSNALEYLWLDLHVRDELKKEGGPLERLVRFLRDGAGIANHEIPQFVESDFDFSRELREKMKSGYEPARYLADRLSGLDGREKRQELTRILNQYTHYAIGQATALTGDDFKQIFFDLRGLLYEQGKNLTLFIEDITTFTGIDRGLLDVLIAQHKGESVQHLCRLISVVGITDAFYRDSMPDNVKERISYHIVLSSEENKALALKEAQALENLASRYLNALRLPQAEFDDWVKNRAAPAELPNACENCQWRETCHRAFGTYTIEAGSGHKQEIGLYPFNSQALHTFYQHIDQTNSRPTQRTFLYNVLYYILRNHGSRLKRQEFPPAIEDLGGEFEGFSLRKPLQRQLIHVQGGRDEQKILTLMAIWGNRTVDAIAESGQPMLIGNISHEVFRAFGLREIQGEPITPSAVAMTSPAQSRTHQNTATASSARQPTSSVITPLASSLAKVQASPTPTPVAVEPEIDTKFQKWNDDIANWLNGQQLQYSGEFIDLLVPFIKESIDWDIYGISQFQVREVLNGRRDVHIEGQFRQTQSTDVLKLERSDELGVVLLGLMELREGNEETGQATWGGYLSRMSSWLNQHEQKIVAYVRQPNASSPQVLSLLHILLLDCLILACLSGAVKPSKANEQSLFLDLMEFCKHMASDNSTKWSDQIKLAEEKRSSRWTSLMKRFSQEKVTELCKNCLQLLNCSQGGSSEVKFVDAAAGLRIIRAFRKNGWQLPEAGIEETGRRDSWKLALDAYKAFQEHFGQIVQLESLAVQEQLNQLSKYTGQDAYKDVFQAMTEMIQTAQKRQKPMDFALDKQYSASGLQRVVDELQRVLEAKKFETQVLCCAAAGPSIDEIKKYITYFKNFEDATKKVQPDPTRLANLRAEGEAVAAREKVQKLYQEIEERLHSFTQSGDEQ